LVAVRVPTPADVADDLPRSARSFRVGETFYVELWVSLDGASDGLAAVYVDMKLDPTRLMFVEVIPGHFFGILSRGTWSSELGLIHSVGGCALLGEDTLGLNAWVRAATVKMHVRGRGTTVVETSQSTGGYGVAILNRLGTLDTSHIAFGEIALDLPGRAHLVDQLQEVEAQNEQTSQGRP
jgi:hypothetical protein